jgi:hypothetical protein
MAGSTGPRTKREGVSIPAQKAVAAPSALPMASGGDDWRAEWCNCLTHPYQISPRCGVDFG